MACELLDKLQRDWQCPKFLSITHKLRSDHDTQFDVRQPRQPLQITVLPGGGSCARAR
jgi:hypothetical protein